MQKGVYWAMQKGCLLGYTLGGVYWAIPPWVCTLLYHSGYMHPLHTPGIPPSVPGRTCRTAARDGHDRYTAL